MDIIASLHLKFDNVSKDLEEIEGKVALQEEQVRCILILFLHSLTTMLD